MLSDVVEKGIEIQHFSIVFGSSEKVYYCSDDETVGFRTKDNYIKRDFTPERFKLFVNFKERTIKSEKLFFIGDSIWDSCLVNSMGHLYCLNQVGGSFSLNTKTLHFHRAIIIDNFSLFTYLFFYSFAFLFKQLSSYIFKFFI